ncbi:hypothetical protein IL306_008313 [Fusarium sp. DS 682]|nr:hypothetical protein IL306_008313 [Fusarium sp. DS 682]
MPSAKDLMAGGADIDVHGGRYGTALQAASSEGHPEIVQLILDNGVDINAQGGEYGNALQGTPYKRKVVQTLNHEGADTTSRKRSGSATQRDPAKQPRSLDPTDVGRT